jgi:diketogulonate reductase-like aldo/keto reductase
MPPLPAAWAERAALREKPIPGTDEKLAVIGMGTWRTFNVGSDPELRRDRARVLKTFFDAGGRVMDSSPMYGSAQRVVGGALERVGRPDDLFAADKVWTRDGGATRDQVASAEAAWGIPRFDLMQVHNLLAWRQHLPTLLRMKEQGAVRYVGITSSHGRRHDELERVMRREPIDFVQLSYHMGNRAAERRLLPLAADRGIGVLVNRPFDGGSLVKGLKRRAPPVPEWAKALGCPHWPAFLLKFIVSHPAVTCAIPATSEVDHMRENMAAARGPLPDAEARERMARHVASL